MDSAAAFALGLAGYSAHRLRPEDAGALQELFDRCRDYCLLVDGEAASPTAGEEVFREVPPGKDAGDKFIFGILDEAGGLAGVLEGVRDYPEARTWWVGLLLLAPETRGHGVGREVVEGFSQYVRAQGGTAVMLGVVEENVGAYRFWQRVGFRLVRHTEPRRFGSKTQRVSVLRRAVAEEGPMEEAILALEKGAMERWRQGDPMGWAEISADDVTYVDPGLVKPIVGLEAYTAFLKTLEGKIRYEGSEFIDPQVVLVGDAALLTYNYRSTASLAELASGQVLWNTTEVYFRQGARWRIAHTHWSFVGHKSPERVEVPVPVDASPAEYEGVLGEVMALESAAMARWRQGDPWGFLEISAPGVTYFDTGTPARLNGLEALEAEYALREGQIHYDVMEFIEPRVQVQGDLAVLLYRFFSTALRPDGAIASRTPWNCTEVYARLGGQWRIIHTHWSLIRGERM